MQSSHMFVDEIEGRRYFVGPFTKCDVCGKEEILIFCSWAKRLVNSDIPGRKLMQDICPDCLKKVGDNENTSSN